MLKKLIATTAMLSLVALTSGCRKTQIEAELKKLEPQHALAQRQLDDFDNQISTLQDKSSQLGSGIRAQNSRMAAYLQEHVLAVTCMAAVGYSIGEDNAFSDDVNKMINAGSLLCVAGVIFSEDFRNEVVAVVETIDTSSKQVKAMRAQLASINSDLEATKRARVPKLKERDELANKIQTLKSELATL